MEKEKVRESGPCKRLSGGVSGLPLRLVPSQVEGRKILEDRRREREGVRMEQELARGKSSGEVSEGGRRVPRAVTDSPVVLVSSPAVYPTRLSRFEMRRRRSRWRGWGVVLCGGNVAEYSSSPVQQSLPLQLGPSECGKGETLPSFSLPSSPSFDTAAFALTPAGE
jgi:hypothetical protein